MTELTYDPDWLVRYVTEAVLRQRGRRALVVLSFPLEAGTARALLAITGVSGLVLPERPCGLEDEPRIGTRPGMTHRRWCFPQGEAEEVVVIGGLRQIGRRGVPELLRRGFWWAWFINPVTGELERRSIFPRKILGVRFLIRLAERVLRPSYELTIGLFYRRVLAHRRDARTNRPRKGSVLLVVGTLGAGGSERQVVNTAIGLNCLHSLETAVAYVDLDKPATSFYRKTLEDAGVCCIDIGAQEVYRGEKRALQRLGLSRLWRLLTRPYALQLEAVMTLIDQQRPEVVHCFLDQTNVIAGTAAVACGVPRVVLSMRSVAPDNFWPNTGNLRTGYRLLARKTEVVFSNNSAVGAADYQRWLGLPDLETKIVPNGIDLSTFEPAPGEKAKMRSRYGFPQDVLVLGGVMRLTEEKRPDLWARTAIEISRRQPEAWFVIAGDGPMMPQIQAMFRRARMLSRVRLLGRIGDVVSVYRMLDLLLLTSRMEGLPNVLIEAQAVGVPVVTTNAGGAGEAVDPGITGLVAGEDSPQALAGLCLKLLNDTECRGRMAAAAPVWARTRFGLDGMLARTLALYTSG